MRVRVREADVMDGGSLGTSVLWAERRRAVVGLKGEEWGSEPCDQEQNLLGKA